MMIATSVRATFIVNKGPTNSDIKYMGVRRSGTEESACE